MTSLVTDYAVIQSNTDVDMMPNIFNLSQLIFMKHLTTYARKRLQLIVCANLEIRMLNDHHI